MSIYNKVSIYFFNLYLALTGQTCTGDILRGFHKKVTQLNSLSEREDQKRKDAELLAQRALGAAQAHLDEVTKAQQAAARIEALISAS